MDHLRVEMEMDGHAPNLSGSVIFRDVAPTKKPPVGMKLMLVVGVVMVPENFVIKGETMVQLRGFSDKKSVVIFSNPESQPLDPKYGGWKIGDILNEAIWKF